MLCEGKVSKTNINYNLKPIEMAHLAMEPDSFVTKPKKYGWWLGISELFNPWLPGRLDMYLDTSISHLLYRVSVDIVMRLQQLNFGSNAGFIVWANQTILLSKLLNCYWSFRFYYCVDPTNLKDRNMVIQCMKHVLEIARKRSGVRFPTMLYQRCKNRYK